MEQKRPLQSIPDGELLRRLAELTGQSRRAEADIVAHIAEVEERRLYARAASPSMFVYCMTVLHLSEAEAYLRIAAARASREHPMILAMLADGRLHLTAIAELRRHLTLENRDGLLARATHRSKRQIEELIAEIAPRPDVPTVMRKLPHRRILPSAGLLAGPSRECCPMAEIDPDPALELVPDGVDRPEPVLRSARTKAPRQGPAETKRESSPSSRHIPAAVRRAVSKRDGDRCRYVDEQGRRCPEQNRLEFHHRHPFALGGDHSLANIGLMCRAHNTYLAERDYGQEAMARHRRPRSPALQATDRPA